MNKQFILLSILGLFPFSLDHGAATAQNISYEHTAAAVQTDNTFISKRPIPEKRLFRSKAVDKEITEVASLLTNPKLRWMFINCYPNTLDTTIHFRKDEEGRPETFVYTGDIPAMWLRDSAAQVWSYLHLAPTDKELQEMIKGVIRVQLAQICIDPYANAFVDGDEKSYWQTDLTEMKPQLHERKWEIDSLCYPIRLAYAYWKATGDSSIFDETFLSAMKLILNTFQDQQRKQGLGQYSFMRKTERSTDSKSNKGYGEPVKPVGLIVSAFRPSDDATHFQFLVPSNFFALTSCKKVAELLDQFYPTEKDLKNGYLSLATEVENALQKHAIVEHPDFGKVYAYEVDGFGNHYFMDDANVPSLLAMPYLGDVSIDDPIYQNTRKLLLSDANPYFFKGKAGEGIGGPHVGYDMIWPMSIIMRAFTSKDDTEIAYCLRMLLSSDADTGLMHESFHKDDAKKYTRPWFSWQNSLFGELIIKLIKEGKIELLNSL